MRPIIIKTAKRTIVFFLFFLMSNYSFSQITIEGIVLANDNNPIHLANVVLMNKEDDHFIKGTVSDEAGHFIMNITDKQELINGKLSVSYVGFLTQYIIFDNDQPIDNIRIVLLPDDKLLNEITITGYQEPIQMRGSVITANVENTLLSKSGRLDDLMNKIPFVSGSNNSYEVFGRGQAVIYLNGRKVREESVLLGLLSTNIRKIDVITNPGPRYDSSVRAVIQIYTIPQKGEGLGGSAYSYMQQSRRFSDVENASLKYRKNNFEWTGSLSYNGTRMKTYSNDDCLLLAEIPSETKSKTDIDYHTNLMNGSIGMNYTDAKKMNMGLSSIFSGGEMINDVYSSGVEHYNGNTLSLNIPMAGKSKNRPGKWFTNLYYSNQLGNSTLSISNDLLLGSRSNLFDYFEQGNNVSVSTEGEMDYGLNSFLTDITTPLFGSELSYGGEVSYSTDNQIFGFDESNINTNMQSSSNKRQQFLLAAYIGFDRKWGIFTLDGGLRYELIQFDYFLNKIRNTNLSRKHTNVYPTLNLSLNPNKDISISFGYKMSVWHPSYSLLNDNIEYSGRYYYIQGNSLLESKKQHSISSLMSFRKVKLIASYDIITDAYANIKNQYKEGEDIILSRTMNLPKYEVVSIGVSWSNRFGIYNPTIDINTGKQFFSYKFLDTMNFYNNLYYAIRMVHSFQIPKDFNLDLSLTYGSKKQRLFYESSRQWGNSIRLNKSIKNGFFIQFGVNNFFATKEIKTIYKTNNIQGITMDDNDVRNISLLISYQFNVTRNRYVNKLKSLELNRF